MHLQPVFDCDLATDSRQRNMLRISQGRRRQIHTFPRGHRGRNGRQSAERPPEQIIRAKVVGGDMAEGLFNRGLCLPSGTGMTEEDLNRVISVILSCKR